MSDLKEHFARINWAEGEIRRLEVHISDYVSAKPLEVYWHHSLHPSIATRLYRVRQRTPVPDAVSIHTGVILNELRACLDALACTLAKRNGFRDVSGVYFPTGKTKAIFESKEIQKKIKKLSATDQSAIAALRPYGGGNEMLYALHSSDLIRKHQRLIVVTGEGGTTSLGGPGEWRLDSSKFNFINAGPGHRLDQPIAEMDHDYHVHLEQHAVVAFSEPSALRSKPVIATLTDFLEMVRAIVEQFR